MRDAPSTQFKDAERTDESAFGRRRPARPGLLQRLTAGLIPSKRGRSHSQMSTLAPPSRGAALREAHRTLSERMRSHPAIRQVLPHLSAIEKGLARRGSKALLRLPVPVLRRGLEQLAVLQRDDESDIDAGNLRVLRLRLIEAIAVRSARAGHAGRATGRDLEPGFDDMAPVSGLNIPAADVSDIGTAEFDEAERAWKAHQAKLPHSRH